MSPNPTTSKKNKRELARERRQKARQRQQIRTIAIISVVALFFAALLIWPSVQPIGDIVSITPQSYPQVDGRAMGDPNAPVKIEVFEDFQCPSCRIFSEETKPEIVANYVATGKVHLTFRHFPFLDNSVPGKESDQAANAAMCAADQNRFWDYHDILFANQNGENRGAFIDRRLTAFAESIGLDMQAFDACFESQNFQEMISQDETLALGYNIRGTPTVVVDGQMMADFSYATVSQGIERALSTQP